MKYILNLFILMFLLGCATSQVEAQSGKTKVQSKIASYEAEKTLDDIKWYDGEPEGIQLIKITISENILTINENVIELPFGNYTNPKILTDIKQNYVSITDKDQDKIYLFDSKSKLVSDFPVFGTSLIDFSINKKKEKMITSLGEPNEILVYSIN